MVLPLTAHWYNLTYLRDIELKISFATPEQDLPQDRELEEILAHAKPASNLAEYAGTITLTEDPLTFQKNIRSEW